MDINKSTWNTLLLVLLQWILQGIPILNASGVYQEYCDTEIFRPDCDASRQVVVIQSAKYGRMKIGRCVEIDLGYIGCHSNVRAIADRICSGRPLCEIRVPDADMEKTRPCLKELKTFLEVGYTCVPVFVPKEEQCVGTSQVNMTLGGTEAPPHTHPDDVDAADKAVNDDQNNSKATKPPTNNNNKDQPPPLTTQSQQAKTTNSTPKAPAVPVSVPVPTSGYLASAITYQTKCGDSERPWFLQAQPGQKINLTLYDFSVEPKFISAKFLNPEAVEICHEYGIIDDAGSDSPQVICGGVDRVTHVYMSRAHTLRVRFTTKAGKDLGKDGEEKYFLLHYQLVGCPDPVVPDNTWYKRVSDQRLEMGCHNTDMSWGLDCVDHKWVGSFGNCSLPFESKRDDLHSRQEAGMSYGIAISIILGAALGVGLVIVVVGIIRYRRRRRGHQHHTCTNGQNNLPRGPRVEEIELKCTCPSTSHGHGAPPASGSSRLCGNSIEEQNTLIKSTPPMGQDTIARHQRTIRINGNEYEHIWESPLPTPTGSSNTLPTSSAAAARENRERERENRDRGAPRHHRHNANSSNSNANSARDSGYTTYKPDRSGRKQPMYVTSRDIYTGEGCSGSNGGRGGAEGTMDTCTLNSARYSALKKGRRGSLPTDV